MQAKQSSSAKKQPILQQSCLQGSKRANDISAGVKSPGNTVYDLNSLAKIKNIT